MKNTFKLFIVAALGIMTVTTSSLKAQKPAPPQKTKPGSSTSAQDENAAIAQIQALLRMQKVSEFIVEAAENKTSAEEVMTKLNNLKAFYSKGVSNAANSQNPQLSAMFKKLNAVKDKQESNVGMILTARGVIDPKLAQMVKNNSGFFSENIDNLSKLLTTTTVEEIKKNLIFKF